MSLLPRPEKKIATSDMTQYIKQYREKNGDHMRTQQRNKYYKNRYNLPPDFVEKYGEYSGDVYKLQKEFDKLHQQCPEITEHVIKDIVPSNNTFAPLRKS